MSRRRSNVLYTHDGLTMPQSDWAIRLGVHATSLRTWMKRFGDDFDAVVAHARRVAARRKPRR